MLKSFINQKLIFGSILIALVLIGSILIIHPILVNAAETTGYEWGHTFGTTDVVGGEEADDYVYDIATDPAGNVYSVGYFSAETAIDLDATAGTDTYSNGGAFITQYSYDGSYMLGKVFENHSDTVDSVMKMYQIEIDLEENIYLYGEFKGTFDFDMGAGTASYTSSNSGVDYNFFIAKYDSSMNYLWVRIVRTTGTSLAQYSQMKTDLQNNVYVCGSFYGTSIDFNGTSGVDMEYSAGGSDAHLTKYFADGSYGWTTRIGGSGEDTCDALALTDDQSILVAGTFQGSSIDLDPSSFFTTNISAVGTTDTYVIRYVATDNTIYGLLTTPVSHVTIGASGATVIPDALDVDNNGNLYLAGTYSGGAILGGPSPDDTDVFLTKYNINTTLDFDWGRFFTSAVPDGAVSSIDNFHALDVAPNGSIYMSTSFYDDVDMDATGGTDTISLAQGIYNDLITKYGTDGSYKWTNVVSNGLGTTNGLVYNNENLYLGGTFQGAIDLDFTAGTDAGAVFEDLDAFIIRNTDADTVSIQNLDSSLTATDTYRDIDATSASRYLYGLRRPIRIADIGNNSAIGEIYTNMYTSRDWTGVSGDSDPIANKVLVDGLNTADGTETKFTLYVPRESGDDRIYICPDASLLSEVSSICTGRYTLFETDNNVSTTTINAQDYWTIENYSNVGAMSASGDTLSHPTTGAYYNQTYTFGNDTTTSYGTQETRLADSVTDSNGNLYIVGYFNDDTGVDFDGTSGTDIHTNTSSTGYDMYITKYNQDGSYAWTETIQTADTGSILPRAIDISSSTNIIHITGKWKSSNVDFDPGVGTDIYTSTDYHPTDYIDFVTKFNNDGSYVSTTNWSGEMDFIDIKTDSLGNYFVAGEFTGTVDPFDLDPTAGTDLRESYYDTVLIKMNSNDTYAWGRSFGRGSEVARPQSITIDNNNNVYVGGLVGAGESQHHPNFDDTGGTDEFHNPDRDFNGDFRDGYLTKYNADGSYGWTSVIPNLGVAYTTLDDVFIRDLKWDTETNTIHVLGTFESEYIGFEYNGEYVTLYNSASESNFEAFWAQYSTNGEVLSIRKIHNSAPDDEYLIEIIPNDNGETYILGKLLNTTTSVDLDLTSGTDNYGPTGTGSYMFISKYTHGEYDWTKYVESTNPNFLKPINLLKYQNDIHILGTYADATTDMNFDISGGTDFHSTAGGEDVFYLKFQDVGPISIQNLDSNLQATDQETDEDATVSSTNFYGPSRTIRVQDAEDLVLADITVDLTADRDWTSVTGDVDLSSKKSVINNLTTAPGTSSTHTLYVPKESSDSAVYLCPDATILSEVSADCTNKSILTEADGNTSITTINLQDYWAITGVSGTGAISASAPDNSGFTISGQGDIYAGKSQTITTVYNDVNGASDLDKLYLSIQNPSGTDIEYYADEGTDGTGLTPTAVTGSEYVTSITYDRDTGAPDANSITITWNISYDWDWTESTNIEFGMKATDDASGDSGYIYTDNNYLYENDLDFNGTLTANSSALGLLTTGNWVPGSDTITWSGVKVVYEGTTDVYPSDSDFDITLTDDDTGSWSDTTSSGENISIVSTTDSATDTEDTHTLAITGIPTGGSVTSSLNFTLKVDASTPDIVDVTGANEGVWQATDSGPVISWTDPTSPSDDTFYITNDGSEPTSSNYQYTTTNPTYDLPDQGDGETSIKVRALNSAGTYSTSQEFLVRYYTNYVPDNSTFTISGHEDIYAGKSQTIITTYSDANSASNLDKLYLSIQNPSGTDIEYYADEGTDGTGLTPTVVTGSEYVTSITYDRDTGAPDANSITITWNISYDWDWIESTNIEFGMKATDDASGDSGYTYTDNNYLYENDLDFNATLTATSSTLGSLTTGDWVPGSDSITWSGVKVVYQGTTDVYPLDSDFDVTLADDDTGSWSDTTSSGENISIVSTTDSATDTEDIHTLTITGIPTGGSAVSSLNFTIKVDASTPDIVDITGDSENTVQSVDSGPVISWTDPNSPSDDTFYITNDGSEPTSSNYQYTSTNPTYDLPDQGEGTTTIRVRALNGVGTYSTTYDFTVIYETIPNIVDITGNDEDTWQSNNSGPVISWTDPSSYSDDTFYITNDGSDPTSSNYEYTTTNPTYDLPDQGEGTTTIKVRAITGYGLESTVLSFIIKYDSSTADIVDITGANEGVWQKTDSGPVISWTDPNSISGDTFYITNDGSTPSSSNYQYTTTFNSYDLPDQGNGETTIKALAVNAVTTGSVYSFLIRYDGTTPDIVDVTGADDGVWQATDSGPIISWTDPNSPSDDTFYITNDGSLPTNSNYQYTTTNPTYDLPDQGAGETTIRVRALNGVDTYGPTYDFLIRYDSSLPDILDITGSYEDTWQTVDAGPIISWTDPNSASDDTFYITLDGSEPSATNYDYSTTNTTFDIPDQAPGETTIKVRPRAGIGTYGPSRSFILKYDPSTPSLGDITGTGENTWQNDDSGPVISWTDPNSPSGDTFYITTDGTEPTNSNYDYTTTSNSYDLPDQGEGTTTVKVRGLNGAGTYSSTLDFIIKYDETAPTNATNFNIEVVGTSELKLTWTNPGTDFSKVRILRKTTGIPGSTSDGTVVYEGSAESYTDSSLNDNTKYYYTIFALDEAGNAASGISNSKTTLEDTTTDTDTDSGDTDTQTPTPNTGDSTPTYNPPTSTIEEPDLSDELEEQAEDSPVIEPEPEKPIAIIKNNNQETEIYTDTKLHLYAGDEIEIHVPRYTLEDEDKSITQALLVIDNETYILAYDESLDSYITKITIESPEGAHTAQIIAIYNDGTTRTLGLNYEIDPYGYVFVMEDGAEQRIKGAQVELWQRQPNASIDLWDTNTAQYPNPQTTDQKGEYKFYVEAGTYQLRVSADGYEDYESDWFEVENNTIEKNIELEKTTNYWWYGLLLIIILIIIGVIYYYSRKKESENIATESTRNPIRTNYM